MALPFASVFLLLLASGVTFPAARPGSAATQQPAPPANSQKKTPPDAAAQEREAEDALEKAVTDAGNDRAALVRNLEQYLQKYPKAPRIAAVYRALIENSQQLHDSAHALEYAEKLIAIQPDNTEMMMLAIGLLEKQGDDASLTRAVDYINRVLDRTEKLLPDDRPERQSLADWRDQRKRLLVALYMIRGRIGMEQKNFPAAMQDLSHSFQITPNAAAAEKLGEIAEMQHRLPDAIEYYADAFALPEDGPGGTVEHKLVRKNLGNVWRQVHGTDAGLGDLVLATYDRFAASSTAAPAPSSPNRNARDLYAYVLRQLDGKPFPLAPLRGKVLVLNFWATWCGPCRELEPFVAQLAEHYASSPDVSVFAVNVDEDQSRVPDFVQREKIKVPVLFSDGLEEFLNVNSIPLVLVLDRNGRIVYSAVGADEGDFVQRVSAAVDGALKPAT